MNCAITFFVIFALLSKYSSAWQANPLRRLSKLSNCGDLTSQLNPSPAALGAKLLSGALALGLIVSNPHADVAYAAEQPVDRGASDVANTKIRKGGASTLQRGITKVPAPHDVDVKVAIISFISLLFIARRSHEVSI